MSHNFWILLTFMSIASICKALPNVHKYMSPQQLQSVFHVENAADVPHYEVVQLMHHKYDATHYRKRRSINAASSPTLLSVPKESHHVKKDLSKNPYYSELKAAAVNHNGGNTLLNSVYANPSDLKLHAAIGHHFSDLSKLAEHNVSFNAFGKQHNLTLRKTEGLLKGAPHQLRMWTVNKETNATNGLDLQEVSDGHHNSEDIGHIFQDEENMAAILMRRHQETGDLIMEGSIGHEMVIKPLPHNLSPSKDEAHHIIYKREPAEMDHFSDFAFMEPDDLASSEKLEKLQQRRQRRSAANLDDLTVAEAAELTEDEQEDELSTAESRNRNRARRQVPYMIYPEILVIVDYDGYRLHGGDNLQVKRYFISFWNGVDLRYRLLKGPRIRISIAGIIISRGRDATPYLERNRVGRDAIDSAAALTDMGKYLFRERRLPVYDIAVAITKYDMCRRRKGGRCTKGTAGFAYVGGACVVNKRLEKVNSVAIIEDTGGFSGIIVAAHEVGHLLGAVHDGSPPPSYLGGPGAQRCRWEDGYIMSDLRHTERGFRWSPCTVQSFHHFLNGDTATCLHNEPHEDSALGRSLPGSLLSLDAQCRRDRGTYACFKDERVCAQLFCFDAQTGYCVAYRPAAEGSSCGNGLHCLDGRCAPIPTNNIGYGQQYRLAYNKRNENANDSSEEDEEDSDPDGDGDYDAALDDNENANDDEINNNSSKSNEEIEGEPNEDENALQNLQRNDNSVEETSLEVKDNDAEVINNFISTTPMPPTPLQIQTQLNAIEYLKYLLQNKFQWEQFTSTTSTTPTITTRKSGITELQPKTIQNGGNNASVIVKTSTSSSVSFSSSPKNIINNNNNKHSIATPPTQQPQKQQQQTSLQNSLKNMTLEFQKQFQNYLNLLQKHQQNQQQESNGILSSINKISSSSSISSSSNIIGNSNNNLSSISSSSNNSIRKSKITTTTTKNLNTHEIKSPTNSPNSNYSATNNQGQLNNNNNNDADNNDDENDNDDTNEESNEAIDKQKRKFDVKFTTRLQQQQQLRQLQNQQQQEKDIPTPTARNNVFGGRTPTTSTTTTTARSNNFLEAYFRKLQAINAPSAPAQIPATAQTPIPLQQQHEPTTPTFNAQSPPSSTLLAQASPPPTAIKLLSTTTTSSTSSTSSASSSSSTAKLSKKQQQRERERESEQQQQKQFDKFAGHFLKRTPLNNRNIYNTNNNNNNNITNIIHKNHNNHHQNEHNQNINDEENIDEVISSIRTTQPPAYVTNYIGDPTNNLPTAIIVSDVDESNQHQKQHHQQQEPPLDSLNLPTTLTTSSQQRQQHSNPAHQTTSSSTTTTIAQQKQKIKTQKLIRRQLLRTQIK